MRQQAIRYFVRAKYQVCVQYPVLTLHNVARIYQLSARFHFTLLAKYYEGFTISIAAYP
jgi:hypothetical protein